MNIATSLDELETVAASAANADDQTGIRCYLHPKRETSLRCIQCERPICAACLVYGPVGQMCRSCAHNRRPINYRITIGTVAIAALVAMIASLVLSAVEVAITMRLPFYSIYLLLVAAPLAARVVVRLLDRVSRAKRGKAFQVTVGLGMAFGALPMLLLALASPLDALLLIVFVGATAYSTMAALR